MTKKSNPTAKKKSKRINKSLARSTPYIVLAILSTFTVASLVVGGVFDVYEKLWWWDDLLHLLSGVIVGLVGYLLVYFFNARYRMTISPTFIALFAFAFAVTAGVFWEIIEFTIDASFGAYMQRWNLPPGAPLLGREYQGSGLRDTMSDLILALVGALFASAFAYVTYKHERPTVLSAMRHTFRHVVPRRTKK